MPGADAIVISNHGGRQLDRAPTPLEQLPSIAAAVGDRAEVYVDGGVLTGARHRRRGRYRALAPRSSGRAYLYGLMAGGERGVQRAGELLRKEAVRTMQLLGVRRIADLDGARPPPRPLTGRTGGSSPAPSPANIPSQSEGRGYCQPMEGVRRRTVWIISVAAIAIVASSCGSGGSPSRQPSATASNDAALATDPTAVPSPAAATQAIAQGALALATIILPVPMDVTWLAADDTSVWVHGNETVIQVGASLNTIVGQVPDALDRIRLHGLGRRGRLASGFRV